MHATPLDVRPPFIMFIIPDMSLIGLGAPATCTENIYISNIKKTTLLP